MDEIERERKCGLMDKEAWDIYVRAGEGSVGDRAVTRYYEGDWSDDDV
jgi:hypothetical protein